MLHFKASKVAVFASACLLSAGVPGSAQEQIYTYGSNNFTNGNFSEDTNFVGDFFLSTPLTQYLEPYALNAREIRLELVNDKGYGFSLINDYVPGLNLGDALTSTFTVIATLNPTETGIDWSQGWDIQMTATLGDTYYAIYSGYSGVAESFTYNGTQNEDQFFERPIYGGGYGLAYYYNQNDPGRWSTSTPPEPPSPPSVPEPSIWAMMLLGFAGLGFAGYRKGRHPTVFAA